MAFASFYSAAPRLIGVPGCPIRNAANYGAVHNDDNVSKQINLPPLYPVQHSEGNYTGFYATAPWT